MKIVVFVTQFYQLSGAEKLAINFAKSAKEAGHDVVILSMYKSDHPLLIAAAPTIARTTHCNIAYLGLPVSPGVKDILTGVLRLRRMLVRDSVALVEASMVGPSTIAALATLGLKTVCLLGIHAVFEQSTHSGTRFTLLKQSLKINRRAKVYCVSRAANIAWADFSSSTRNSCKTIYNAIDDEFLDKSCSENPAEPQHLESGLQNPTVRDELNIPPQSQIILFVGSLVKNKGIDIALHAAAPLLQYEKCHFLLIGEAGKIEQFNPGDDTFYQSFFSSAKALEQAGVLSFLGHRTDIAQLMRQSTVLIHPARSEGFGLVIAEALACGLPVVASRCGGIPEVVGDCPAAQLCESEDVLAFRQSLVTMLSKSQSERSELRLAAQQQGARFTTALRTHRLLTYAFADVES